MIDTPMLRHLPNALLVPLLALCLALSAVAAASGQPLLWFADGRPTAAALEVVAILTAAPDDGLDARDYDADGLRTAVARADREPSAAPAALAPLDTALTAAFSRYLADLHSGRVAPREIGEDYDPLLQRRPLDLGAPGTAAREARPPLAEYAALREALARYRALATDPAWRRPLPPLPGTKLEPGQAWSGVADLRRRLELLGDLPAGTAGTNRYEGASVAGVRAFQSRHGLTPDGIIGKGTLEQLSVPPEARVRQLELALERLRWTPLLPASRVIVVNIPEFRVRAYEVRDGKVEMKVAMNIIVGNAAKTRTPIFGAEMRFVEFSPYWNVPPSIAKGETLPRLRREPGYFDQQGFEFVGRDGRVVSGYSEASLDAVQRGEMRIRQRPGARNALGDIKFIFPNSDNIYLHHTPTPQLFKRDRRDFSHGCIRVEEPVALAKFVLADEPEWTEERIVQAMTKGRSATLRLREPFPVVIAYTTAVVREGRVHFFPDIYGHDKILDQALRQRSQSSSAFNQFEIGAKSNH
jgi:murein L,D-transpeptidase YcbB/YkuD